MRLSSAAFATGAVAQYSSQFLASNPGGALPANVQAPSIAGFQNATIAPSRGGLAVCVSGIVPVTANATNLKLNLVAPQNQTQVAGTVVDTFTSSPSFMQQVMNGTQAVKGTYNIGATFCTPANNTRPSTVQILTHGVGFDRYYWDFAPGYSYVDVAAQYNHATFFYDRLGNGQSSHPDAIKEVQAPLQVEILHQLITKLKNGTFSNVTFPSVVGTGHSYGSALTQGVTANYPSDLSTAILTGFSMNMTGMQAFMAGLNLQIASLDQPYRFSGLNNSYLVAASPTANQISFMRFPDFDPAILHLADATKGTETFAEFLTLASVIKPASSFTGNVAVVNGAHDLPFCAGNCTYPFNLAQPVLTQLYAKAANNGSFFAPGAGHGLNLHYSAVTAYHYIQDFVRNHTTTSS